MIIDFRTYTYFPAGFPTFLRMYRETGFAITTRCLGTTLGIFTSHSGKANRTLQLFAYRDFAHRDECRARLRQDREWLSFIKDAAPFIREQENTILEPVAGAWAEGPGPLCEPSPSERGGLFELRRERGPAHAFRHLLSSWSERCIGMQPASVLRPLTGALDTVHVLSRYPDDTARRTALDEAPALSPLLGDEGLGDAITSIETELWLPTDYSPQQ